MSEPDSSTGASAKHTHVCAKCNRQFECGGETCEAFHFSLCDNCQPKQIDPDAPESPKPEEGGDKWLN